MPSSQPKAVIHVISHTHWDREWYMPYEAHHAKLIQTMDELLAIMDRDPEYRSFYLDGQTIVLDDYLQVYPEKREKLVQLVQEGRLSAGPWYILQDEFLTSSEANVRNLQIGHRDSRAFGPVSKLGYFPDSFGNMGQAAQLMQQAGITTAVFGRGVKATGFNNSVSESPDLESPYSEMNWDSPDGSRVLGILFANWYNNGMEIPEEPAAAKAFWDHAIASASRYASTRHLLLMNGCDHQPAQANLSAALRTARELYPDYEFIHSNWDDYVKAVHSDLPPELSTIKGELRGQRTDGWFSLVNTASARIYIKQLNQQNQTMLEKIAEPLAAFAHAQGRPYPHGLLNYAWRTLMQNHPHDSICGCSVDEVYHEMRTRFEKSKGVAASVIADSTAFLGGQIDTTGFAAISRDSAPFAVFSTSGYEDSGVVTVELELGRRYFKPGEAQAETAAIVGRDTTADGYLVDADGKRVPFVSSDLGVRFGYDLPADKFRQPYFARVVSVTFEAAAIPAMGYGSFAWIPSAGEEAGPAAASLVTAPNTLENDFLRVSIQTDGTLTMLDKTNGQTFDGLGYYENVGDVGNEYIFKQPNGDTAITTRGLAADIRLVEDAPHRAVYEVTHTLDIPESADERLQAEIATMVPFLERQAQRSSKRVPLSIVTRVSLSRSERGVRAHASFDNQAKDHRLRVMLPSGVSVAKHYADSIFEVAERATVPNPEWVNPSNCQHQSAFVDVHEAGRGLTVGNKGLNEYEVLRDDSGTIAVTILRSTGELGDWGVFPTPDAQCLGRNEAEWILLPHGGADDRFRAYQAAYGFQVPLQAVQTGLHAGPLAPRQSLLNWNGAGSRLALSSLKVNEDRGDLVARWYNLSGEPSELRVDAGRDAALYESNVLEEDNGARIGEAGSATVPVAGYKIVSIGLRADK
ncbi:alpha-mannosidase [Paenibacillus sacheonensis]|uniref:Alpha-mannosidase n=1 Tax=Paenibacillus sacheonensis TaxID=742054 RepID=A0A7X5BVU4_9BACL|nr:alpha-mannosidase [Paenibacillus sacheonensis]MBM7565968.1 alpha-mannosidase [Paenibacillus sacheonensis]NBC68718.1 alpha-mannosidase [Paenibacillus sacheonensis]